MGELIPLFPLGTPLFPGVVLPLRIFEPRYRRLMADLLELPPASERRFFGVVAIRSGWEVEQVTPARALYDVGCTALLQTVRPQPDGGFRIVTLGGRRFRLLDVVVGEDPPYLQGEVDWLPAAPPEAVEDAEQPAGSGRRDEATAAAARGSLTILTGVVRDLLARYVAEVAVRSADGSEEDAARLLTAAAEDPESLSWLVASAALLTTEDRQALLAESETRRRLAAETRVLRRELTLLQTLGAVPVPLQELAVPMAVN
jgi:Lon protease-like protein